MAGCSTQDLPESWEPLTTLVERPKAPGIGDDVVTTVIPNLYVADIDQFHEDYPEGSVEHEALRRHEVQHALDQKEYLGDTTGVIRTSRLTTWIRHYLTDKSFRWEVEKKGYKAGILYYLSKGYTIIPEAYADILSGSTYNNMVSYEEALEWVKELLKSYYNQ